MTSVEFYIPGPAPTLLVLALLAAGARALEYEHVTTGDCKARDMWQRVRLYPTDVNATFISLWGCGLTELNQGYQATFTGLPNLKTIDLGYNVIEKINPAALHAVPTLKTLWLNDNKLRELPIFDERSCSNLTELFLSQNQLTGIENERTFFSCTKLTRLTFSKNHIDFIHPNAFKQLTELEHLYLDRNEIRSIPDQLFVSNSKLEQLYLNNNRITHLPPKFASSLKRAGAGLKEFRFYHNPWHCACLVELLMDVRKAGVPDCPSCYDGIQPVCVHINAYECRDIRKLSALLFERKRLSL